MPEQFVCAVDQIDVQGASPAQRYTTSKAGDIVADLFGGSGSTLIACERRNRKARLMELDRRYADVTCQRYQEYTGKQGTLEGDGGCSREIGGSAI